MGVDTKIRIPMINCDVDITTKKVAEIIQQKMKVFGTVDIRPMQVPGKYDEENTKSMFNMWQMDSIEFALDYPCDGFESNKEQRMLRTYYDHYTGGNMLSLSMGAWGHNVELAKCIVDNFGGYADFSDCDSITIDYAKPQPTKKVKGKKTLILA
jgi:hypothetical protein